MRNTQFNSKETYLAYRSEWKATYKELSQKIRKLRKQFRSQRGIDSGQYWASYNLRTTASCMIGELKEAKQEAQRQYLAANATLTPA